MSALAITPHDPQPSPFHKGCAPKYHARLKHDGRTLAVLQGDTRENAFSRAESLTEALLLNRSSVSIEDA